MGSKTKEETIREIYNLLVANEAMTTEICIHDSKNYRVVLQIAYNGVYRYNIKITENNCKIVNGEVHFVEYPYKKVECTLYNVDGSLYIPRSYNKKMEIDSILVAIGRFTGVYR